MEPRSDKPGEKRRRPRRGKSGEPRRDDGGTQRADGGGNQRADGGGNQRRDGGGTQRRDGAPQQREAGGRGDGRRRKRRRRPKQKKGPPPEAKKASPLEAAPEIDTSKAAFAPLSEDERAVIRAHFRFIAKHRKILRVKLNAAEDLLVNGVKEPEHRGVCLHLLGKVDRACINAALTRIDDEEKKTRLLEGVVRFSRDVAIVLLYLESLSSSGSRDEAAAAVAAAFEQIEFKDVSAAQMRRLLELAASLFDAKQLPQLVLGLLGNDGFKETFDQSLDDLPASLTDLFAPLRAVHAVVIEGRRTDLGDDVLARGLDLLLAAPDAMLRSHPESMRRRLVQLALDLEPESAERALATLLDSFDKKGRHYSDLAMHRARRMLAAARDDDARAILTAVREHHPGFKLPGRLLTALDAPRVGRIALLDDRPESIRRGLWLDEQYPVWVRVGTQEQTERFAHAAALHKGLLLPNVAPLLVSGTTSDGPFFAVPQVGTPATGRVSRDLARAGIEILSALAWAGVVLPDASADRFLLQGDRLWLWSLLDAHAAQPEDARREMVDPARAWCKACKAFAAVDQARDLEPLAAALQ